MDHPPSWVPVATPLTRPFWQSCANGELAVQHCADCDRSYFPPRRWCPTCLGANVEWRPVSGRAALHTYLIQHRAMPGIPWEPPYAVAVVELAEGPRMMTTIVDIPSTPEDLVLDMPLQVRFVERGEMALPVFGPVR